MENTPIILKNVGHATKHLYRVSYDVYSFVFGTHFPFAADVFAHSEQDAIDVLERENQVAEHVKAVKLEDHS